MPFPCLDAHLHIYWVIVAQVSRQGLQGTFTFGADQMLGGHAGTCRGGLLFSSNLFLIDSLVRLRIAGALLQPFCEEKQSPHLNNRLFQAGK